MTVLYVSNAQIPSAQANSIQIVRMCEAFAQEGNRVVLLCSGDADTAAVARHYGTTASFGLATFTARNSRQLTFVRLARMAAYLVREQSRIDVAYGRYVPGLILCALCGIPALIETHVLASGWRRGAETLLFLLSGGQRMISISGALADDYAARYAWLGGRFTPLVAHDGAVFDGEPLREPVPVPRVRIGYAGSFFPGKGAELVAVLAGKVPEHDFHLWGGDLAALHQVMPAEWQAPPNLFVHGRVAPHEVSARLRGMDILLLPAQPVTTVQGKGNIARWMSPLKLFEYMASGRPMVCSDLPVFREVVRPEEHAVIVPPADLAAWSAAVRRLAGAPELRRRLAGAALAEGREHYSWRARTRRVILTFGTRLMQPTVV